MEKLLKIIRRRFSRFQLNHSPHPFPICSERLWHEKCVVNISREGKKYFPILRLMYFLHSLCTSRLLCELTQWVEYKFHVFGFLPSNSSIHAILPLRRISLNCIKLTFVVKFQFVFRLEPILYLFVIVPSKFPARFANQVDPPPKWFASLWWQCISADYKQVTSTANMQQTNAIFQNTNTGCITKFSWKLQIQNTLIIIITIICHKVNHNDDDFAKWLKGHAILSGKVHWSLFIEKLIQTHQTCLSSSQSLPNYSKHESGRVGFYGCVSLSISYASKPRRANHRIKLSSPKVIDRKIILWLII